MQTPRRRPLPPDALVAQEMKRALRTQMKLLREKMPAEKHAERSRAICQHVMALDEFQSARSIASFVPMGTEIDVTPIAEACFAAGKTLSYPRVTPQGLVLQEVVKETELVAHRFGMLEPPAGAPYAPLEAIDLCVVPALSLDLFGARVGYGAGYYDRLLPKLTNALRVGVIFDRAISAQLPMIHHDQRVHVVISEARVHRVEAEE